MDIDMVPFYLVPFLASSVNGLRQHKAAAEHGKRGGYFVAARTGTNGAAQFLDGISPRGKRYPGEAAVPCPRSAFLRSRPAVFPASPVTQFAAS